MHMTHKSEVGGKGGIPRINVNECIHMYMNILMYIYIYILLKKQNTRVGWLIQNILSQISNNM